MLLSTVVFNLQIPLISLLSATMSLTLMVSSENFSKLSNTLVYD